MFAESRAVGSTPESWREHFGRFRRVTPWGALRMRLMPEWRLITKYTPRGARVLDAGCGTGDWAYLMTRLGRRVTGLDYSADIIGRVERHYPAQEWRLGDVRAIPFRRSAVRHRESWGIIEHDASGPRAALREFRRVLVPGGVAIVSVPNDSALRRGLAAARATGSQSEFFQYFMTAAELAEEVRAAGFDVVESGTLAWPSLELALPRASARIPSKIF